MIEIKNIYVRTKEKEILKGVTLSIEKGQMHAIMGPNGAGKSTLARVLAGDSAYEVTQGEIWFKGKNLLECSPEERAHLGLFLSFQYPVEIAGVSNLRFLQAALNAQRKGRGEDPFSEIAFQQLLEEKMKSLEIRPEFIHRNVNEGFSGGEKKRNEILQMALFTPDFSILDETDSGLDIDALRSIAEGINRFRNIERSLLVITHYQRLLDFLRPDVVHVLIEGRIVQSGGAKLAMELEAKGYGSWTS
jgi:Fe-S cluster assembly ATP-binding protein